MTMYGPLAVLSAKALSQTYDTSDAETKILIEHDCVAGAAALIPIPGADVAVMLGNQIVLYGRLNSELDISISKDTLKSIGGFMVSQIAGIVSVIPVAIAAQFASQLLKFIPGPGSIAGAAVGAGANAAITHVLGLVYLVTIKKMVASGKEFSAGNIKENLKEQFADKDFIRETYAEAKAKYKNTDFNAYKNQAEEIRNSQ